LNSHTKTTLASQNTFLLFDHAGKAVLDGGQTSHWNILTS